MNWEKLSVHKSTRMSVARKRNIDDYVGIKKRIEDENVRKSNKSR
jgi:hypothetical protein